MSIFGDFREVANSAKIKPTQKIPDIRYVNLTLFTFFSQLHTQIDISLCEHHSPIIRNCLYIIICHSNCEIKFLKKNLDFDESNMPVSEFWVTVLETLFFSQCH